MIVLEIGDLVLATNYCGVYRIQRFSENGVIAEIQQYHGEKPGVPPQSECISVPVTTLRPFVRRNRKSRFAP
jgi:hypothetical protein